MEPSLEPESPAEFQALAILVSAAHLAEEIDSLRHGLASREAQPHRSGMAARLLEVAERLINLLALLRSRSHEYGPGFATRMDEQADKLRRRLLGSTRELVIDRARAVSRRAAAVLDGSSGYPLGLTDKLRDTLSSIEMNLDVLGGVEMLSDEERAVLAEAGVALTRLAPRETVYELLETA